MSLSRFFFPDDNDDRREVERFFPLFAGLQHSAVSGGGRFAPKFDILRTDNKLSILAELPGLSKEDVSVSLEGGRLSICGSARHENDYSDAEARVTHRERSFGSFCRTLGVPESTRAEDVKASMENGVLRVELPSGRLHEESKSKKIEIK